METKPQSFDDLAGDPEGTVLIDGKEWKKVLWTTSFCRHLVRLVQSGVAKIENFSSGGFKFSIEAPDNHLHCEIKHEQTYPGLSAAAKAAEAFEWSVIECGSFKWYQTRNDTSLKQFRACMSETDVAVINLWPDGKYSMTREISPRYGESYEISARRYETGEGSRAVTSFNEAVAIVTTMPMFVSALAASPNADQPDEAEGNAAVSSARPRF